MKKGFIFILILAVLFVGAILIYDFSDIPSEMLAGHDWYLIENNDVYVLNLENNKFSFKNKNNDEERYQNCNTYKYNNSSNVIKLDCSIKNNKLYIATFDENKLVATINGEEKTLYKSEELAYEYKFMSDNGLSEQEYNELYKLNFDEKYFINVKEFLSIYKGKNKKKVVLVSNSYNYKNILDYVKLSKILDDSYKLIAIDSLSENDLQSLFNKIGITDYDNSLVTVYLVGNKNTSISEVIDIKNIKEI